MNMMNKHVCLVFMIMMNNMFVLLASANNAE